VGWFAPNWGAPPGVHACMTTRTGGVSAPPFDSLNLGDHVGDEPACVEANRDRLHRLLGLTPTYLRQVHGTRMACLPLCQDVAGESARPLDAPSAGASASVITADGAVTRMPGVACAVMIADCLPVLMAAPQGRAVAAVHAGWRGLDAGVLEAGITALCEMAACEPAEVAVWLGPCIGPQHFEVGEEVAQRVGPERRRQRQTAQPLPKWLVDLPGWARDRLRSAGATQLAGNDGSAAWCTVSDVTRFFSHRRDGGASGRMLAAVWIGDTVRS